MTPDIPGPRVLVVDDEPTITELVGMALRYEGFTVSTAATGQQALDAIRADPPDLVVLDVMLPDLDGFTVTQRLAERGQRVPVLFLTARDATEDKVRGLTIGGDDYVTKPFSVAELVARVRVVLRRAGTLAETGSTVTVADLVLDTETREVTRAGREIELTATEWRLLHYLMINPRRVLTRAQILDHVWDYDFGGDAGVLETHISYLRKKVDAGSEVALIHTVRGVGYSLRPPKSAG